MLYDCASGIESNVVLFEDAITTNFSAPGAIFRELTEGDKESIASQGLDTDARWLVEADGVVVHTHDFATNNPAFDLAGGTLSFWEEQERRAAL